MLVGNKVRWHGRAASLLGRRRRPSYLARMALCSRCQCDMVAERQVPRDVGVQLSNLWASTPYYETSAAKSINVDEVFQDARGRTRTLHLTVPGAAADPAQVWRPTVAILRQIVSLQAIGPLRYSVSCDSCLVLCIDFAPHSPLPIARSLVRGFARSFVPSPRCSALSPLALPNGCSLASARAARRSPARRHARRAVVRRRLRLPGPRRQRDVRRSVAEMELTCSLEHAEETGRGRIGQMCGFATSGLLSAQPHPREGHHVGHASRGGAASTPVGARDHLSGEYASGRTSNWSDVRWRCGRRGLRAHPRLTSPRARDEGSARIGLPARSGPLIFNAHLDAVHATLSSSVCASSHRCAWTRCPCGP